MDAITAHLAQISVLINWKENTGEASPAVVATRRASIDSRPFRGVGAGVLMDLRLYRAMEMGGRMALFVFPYRQKGGHEKENGKKEHLDGKVCSFCGKSVHEDAEC